VSRSYSKVPYRRDSEYFKIRDIRILNRASIHQELVNPDYGDALFVSNKKLFSHWHYYRKYRSKKEIRNEYFLEIRNILNGYTERYMSWDEDYTEAYNYFRGCLSDDVRIYPFEWLLSKKVREIIKSWQGKPLDVLDYLAQHGYIEKAVRQQFRKETRK
jgi:hypothetical protein